MANLRSLGVRRARWLARAANLLCAASAVAMALGGVEIAGVWPSRDAHAQGADTEKKNRKAEGSAPKKPDATANPAAKGTSKRNGGGKRKAKKTSSAKSKHKAAGDRASSRRRASRPGANMPKGFVWPPSAAMRAAGDRCLAQLEETDVAFVVADKNLVDRKARLVAPVIVADMKFGGVSWVPTFRKPPFVMDCHLAVALHGVGDALRDLGVQTVHFSRIYEFTRVRTGGRQRRAVSRHALGLAIDIRKFEGLAAQPSAETAAGTDAATAASATDTPIAAYAANSAVRSIDTASASTTIVTPRVDGIGHPQDPATTLAVVHTDYATSAWLKAIETALNASGRFRTVLSPANDPKSHYDHFHVEAAASFAP